MPGEEFPKFEEIPIELIKIGPQQSRTRKVEENVDELAENIKKHGLINPITVYPENGKYILITGQRRFLAAQKLGWKKIPAKIIKKPTDPLIAKIISLSENLMRRDLIDRDCADAFKALFRKYGSIKAIVDETGIPRAIVQKHLKYEALPDKLKKMVDDKIISFSIAEKARDAAIDRSTGEVDVEKAVKLAMAMKAELPKKEQRDALVELAKSRPEKSPEELVEEAKKAAAVKISVTLGPRWYTALRKAAEERMVSEEEVATTAIMDWLEAKGYV